MLTVIIPTHNQAAELATLLEALVPAAVDGLVREVIVADGGSTDLTLEICEDAGAVVVTGGIAEAARAAKAEWVLLAPVTLQLAPTWMDGLKAHLSKGRRGVVLSGRREPGLLARLRPAPTAVLISGEALSRGAGEDDVAALVRKLGAGLPRI